MPLGRAASKSEMPLLASTSDDAEHEGWSTARWATVVSDRRDEKRAAGKDNQFIIRVPAKTTVDPGEKWSRPTSDL